MTVLHNSNAPSVTVIIPTYNREKFISCAVQSVLNQTLKNVEIIVIDDGSTDNTKEVLEQFKGKIRYIASENEGASHARNLGMKSATGKYIAFLDSDDTYLPIKLELQASFMEDHPEVGMSFTEVSSTDGRLIEEEYHLRSYHSLYNRKGWRYEDMYPHKGEHEYGSFGMCCPYYVGHIFKHVLMGPVVFTNTMMFPREILRDVGYQNEHYRHCEEYEFAVRICKLYKVAFLNVPTYLYRYHADQISMVKQPRIKRKILEEIETENVITQAILDHGYNDSNYYALNRDWLDRQLAEQYLCLGQKWLDCEEPRKAREYFLKGHASDPSFAENKKYILLSFLPEIVRRAFEALARRLRR